MPRRSDKTDRERAQQRFDQAFAATGDYRAASRAAGVSERTGRRWRVRAVAAQRVSALRVGRPATTFEGRREELDALQRRFRQGSRLVTVLGPAGMGKTRLALEWVESDGLSCFDEGRVFFCDLRRAETETALVSEVARCLEVRLGEGSTSPTNAIEAALPTPLRLTEEVTLELGPLDLPSPNTIDEAAWDRNEAVRLFWARAKACEPLLEQKSISLSHLATLLKRLEGIPLAIELAAAQLRGGGIMELLQELDESIAGLQSPLRDVDPDHATLFAAIDRSWRLLATDEKEILARLSVFRGGFDLDAAAAIEPESSPRSAATVIALLREASNARRSSEAA